MKIFLMFIISLFTIFNINGQSRIDTIRPRWEVSVGSGLYVDLMYANILSNVKLDPPGYPSKPGKRINPGKVDRLEVKYLLNNKSAISVYYQNELFYDLLGTGNDPLSLWTELRRKNKRMHFTINYNRFIPSGKRGTWTIASGFQVQIEKFNFPIYSVDNSVTPPIVTRITARPKGTYWEDWAIPLTVAYHWTINKNLKLGLLYNSSLIFGMGVEGMSLQGNIAIPFGNPVGRFKGRRIITP